MQPFRAVLDTDALTFFSKQTSRDRAVLLDIFRELAVVPHQRGEKEARDPLGRILEIKRFGRWTLTYWTDDPVHELRIVEIEKASSKDPLRRRP